MKPDADNRPLGHPTASDGMMENERIEDADQQFDRAEDPGEAQRGHAWDEERGDESDLESDVRPTEDADLIDETEDRE
jgi:hypothetical protein